MPHAKHEAGQRKLNLFNMYWQELPNLQHCRYMIGYVALPLKFIFLMKSFI